MEPVLSVRDLRIDVGDTGVDIVDEVSFDIHRGEVLGLVGESGCGKTAVALGLLNHARPGTRIVSGEIRLHGQDLMQLGSRALRRLRGDRIAYVPQDPSRSLNPRHRVGQQIAEALAAHGHNPDAERDLVNELLGAVMLPASESFLRRYPHELSGGQQQRIVLVMALVCKPDVVVLDEPTTGLDVITQARVLQAISNLTAVSAASFVHVTHDLAVVANLARRIGVMYSGRLVELGPTMRLLAAPAHPYTKLLIASTPQIRDTRRPEGMRGTAPGPGARPAGCFFAPRCPLSEPACELSFPPREELGADHFARCFRWKHTSSLEQSRDAVRRRAGSPASFLEVRTVSARYPRGTQAALTDISFTVGQGECVAVVGESGSGKSTLARCIAGLHPTHAGDIMLRGSRLHADVRVRTMAERRAIQLIYQNPDRSLNPRRTVADQLLRPLHLFGLASGVAARREVTRLLDRVRLPYGIAARFPPELSGGERQRAAIARALAAQPQLLLCDEVTSSLDVSVQAAVLELFEELRGERSLSFVYISHDLGVVATIADRILVLHDGMLRENAPTTQLLSEPQDEYTRDLITAMPELPTLR